MVTTTLVYRTAVASLGVQLVMALVTAVGFLVPLPSDAKKDLVPIFALEVCSQVVELVWYAYVVCRFREIVTWTRYIDWVISTPVMLLSTMLFFEHRGGRALAVDDPLLHVCLGLNWGMLAFGFALETGRLEPFLGLAFGGVAFVVSFTALATFVDTGDALSVGLFATIYAVWALYGVAAALGDVPKNVSYNGLDIVSKNFYGVFLLVYALAL